MPGGFNKTIEVVDAREPLEKIVIPEELPSQLYVIFEPTIVGLKVEKSKPGRPYTRTQVCSEPRRYAIPDENVHQFFDYLSTDATLYSLMDACKECGVPMSKDDFEAIVSKMSKKLGVKMYSGGRLFPVTNPKNNDTFVDLGPKYTMLYTVRNPIDHKKSNIETVYSPVFHKN